MHGLFLKRQMEVSKLFAEIQAREVLHSQSMWESILNGPLSHNFESIVRQKCRNFIDSMVGSQIVAVKVVDTLQLYKNLYLAVYFAFAIYLSICFVFHLGFD